MNKYYYNQKEEERIFKNFEKEHSSAPVFVLLISGVAIIAAVSMYMLFFPL